MQDELDCEARQEIADLSAYLSAGDQSGTNFSYSHRSATI